MIYLVKNISNYFFDDFLSYSIHFSCFPLWCPKYWSFSFSITPSKEIPGLISFRMDWLDLSRVFSNTTVQKHQFFDSQPSSQSSSLIHDHWKTIALTRRTSVGKVMSLLLNMLSRLVMTFLPRSKRLLISWLQSPSALILEPLK